MTFKSSDSHQKKRIQVCVDWHTTGKGNILGATEPWFLFYVHQKRYLHGLFNSFNVHKCPYLKKSEGSSLFCSVIKIRTNMFSVQNHA